jgi:HPt (histidine-containing phosphotransfer) domain-containing protein
MRGRPVSNVDGTATPTRLVSHLLVEEEDLRDIVEEFVNGLSDRLGELKSAHEALDWELLRTLAHRLKGAGGSYGYPAISELGKTMEDEFKSHRANDIAGLMKRFEQLIDAAAAGLRRG